MGPRDSPSGVVVGGLTPRPALLQTVAHRRQRALRARADTCNIHPEPSVAHLDSLVSYGCIPSRLRRRTAIAAAADRFYRVRWKGAKFSLLYNAFPIERVGGRKALEDAEELLDKELALIVYPEGTRSRDGRVQPFHHGVSILALEHRVPVIPIYMHGTAAIMPVGSRRLGSPGPVTVAVGAPVWLEPGISIPEGTSILEESMRALEYRFTPAVDLLPGGVPVGSSS